MIYLATSFVDIDNDDCGKTFRLGTQEQSGSTILGLRRKYILRWRGLEHDRGRSDMGNWSATMNFVDMPKTLVSGLDTFYAYILFLS